MPDATKLNCQQCGRDPDRDGPEPRLELTDEDEPVVYCVECWQREFGE